MMTTSAETSNENFCENDGLSASVISCEIALSTGVNVRQNC